MKTKKPRIKTETKKGKKVVVKDFKKGNRRFKKARYEKEKSVYKQLEKIDEVQTPELIKADDEKKVLVLEKLEQEPIKQKDNKEIAEKLIEFQFSDVKPKESVSLKVSDDLGVRTIFDTIFSIRKIGLRNAFLVFKNLISYYFNYKKLDEEILIHNDLNKGNIMKEDGEIKFLYLESATTSKKWLYKDIIHYAYNFEEQKLNKDLIKEYEKQLKQKHPNTYKKINKQKEIQMAMIKYSIGWINKRSSKNKKVLKKLNNTKKFKNILC